MSGKAYRGLGLVGVVISLGCAAARPYTGPALCQTSFEDAQRRTPAPGWWPSLLLHQYDAASGRMVGPPLDCTGTPLTWAAATDGCGQSHDQTPLPNPRLAEAGVRVEPVGKNLTLVWVQAYRYADGEVLGPIALVESLPTAQAVVALGSLRAEPDRVKLKLLKVAGNTVLWTESEVCPSKDLTQCRRAVRLLPQRAQRFIQEPLRTAAGACVGPSWFPTQRTESFKRAGGWVESFELLTTVDPGPEGLTVHEQMTVREADPKQGPGGARVLRTAQGDRAVQVRPDGLVVDEPSLWGRVIDTH